MTKNEKIVANDMAEKDMDKLSHVPVQVNDGKVVEQVHIVMATDINGAGRLFGGRLMEWIDVLSAVVARDYTHLDVTTVKVEELVFEKPAYINDTIIMRGKVVSRGKTSVSVEILTYARKLTGEEFPINTALLKMVAIDSLGRAANIQQTNFS